MQIACYAIHNEEQVMEEHVPTWNEMVTIQVILWMNVVYVFRGRL